ncbi:MAG: hypothetical protein AAFR75_04970 [Pseudomonadota bacterium]
MPTQVAIGPLLVGQPNTSAANVPNMRLTCPLQTVLIKIIDLDAPGREREVAETNTGT